MHARDLHFPGCPPLTVFSSPLQLSARTSKTSLVVLALLPRKARGARSKSPSPQTGARTIAAAVTNPLRPYERNVRECAGTGAALGSRYALDAARQATPPNASRVSAEETIADELLFTARLIAAHTKVSRGGAAGGGSGGGGAGAGLGSLPGTAADAPDISSILVPPLVSSQNFCRPKTKLGIPPPPRRPLTARLIITPSSTAPSTPVRSSPSGAALRNLMGAAMNSAHREEEKRSEEHARAKAHHEKEQRAKASAKLLTHGGVLEQNQLGGSANRLSPEALAPVQNVRSRAGSRNMLKIASKAPSLNSSAEASPHMQSRVASRPSSGRAAGSPNRSRPSSLNGSLEFDPSKAAQLAALAVKGANAVRSRNASPVASPRPQAATRQRKLSPLIAKRTSLIIQPTPQAQVSP